MKHLLLTLFFFATTLLVFGQSTKAKTTTTAKTSTKEKETTTSKPKPVPEVKPPPKPSTQKPVTTSVPTAVPGAVIYRGNLPTNTAKGGEKITIKPTVTEVNLTTETPSEEPEITDDTDPEEKGKWRPKINVGDVNLPGGSYNFPSVGTREARIKGVLGPDVLKPNNVKLLVRDNAVIDFFESANISSELFKDKNEREDVYYFLPKKYTLKYIEALKDYSFEVYFKSADVGNYRVVATAKLFPDIDPADVEIAEQILGKSLNKPKLKLIAAPLMGAPRVDFQNFLKTNFNIEESSVSAHASNDIFEPIILSWRMDASTANNMISVLTSNLEIPGLVNFQINTSDENKDKSVPFTIRFNDAQTLLSLEYNADENKFDSKIENRNDYPIQIQKVSVLSKYASVYEVESFETKKVVVHPQTSISIEQLLSDKKVLKKVLDKKASKVWFDFKSQECNKCDQLLQEKLLSGTSDKIVKKLEIQVLNPIEASGSNSFRITVKSIQADPKGKMEVTFSPFVIKEDNTSVTVGELFIPNGSNVEYSYKISQIENDGTVYESDWIKSSDLFLVFGEATVNAHVKK